MVNALEHQEEIAPNSEQLLEYPVSTSALNDYSDLTEDALKKHRCDLITCYESNWESSCSLLLNTFFESVVREAVLEPDKHQTNNPNWPDSNTYEEDILPKLQNTESNLSEDFLENIYKEKVLFQHEQADIKRKNPQYDLEKALDIYDTILYQSQYDVPVVKPISDREQSSDYFGLSFRNRGLPTSQRTA
jgi:hypothetical protein